METDIRFLQGGEARVKKDIIGLLKMGILSKEQIAQALDVPIEFVNEVKKQHNKVQKELTYVRKPRINKSK